MNFYETKKWKNKRENILRRDGYLCQECLKFGKHSDATTVHHIKHYDEFPELALDDSNLISLCASCHNKAHPEKAKFWKPTKSEGSGKTNITLVIGLPTSGKTTYIQNHKTNDSLIYDLDYIAAAFQYCEPHKANAQAKCLANEMLNTFVKEAPKLSNDIFIIRTAPTAEEIKLIKPTNIVCLFTKKNISYLSPIEKQKKIQRIQKVLSYANILKIKVETIETK